MYPSPAQSAPGEPLNGYSSIAANQAPAMAVMAPSHQVHYSYAASGPVSNYYHPTPYVSSSYSNASHVVSGPSAPSGYQVVNNNGSQFYSVPLSSSQLPSSSSSSAPLPSVIQQPTRPTQQLLHSPSYYNPSAPQQFTTQTYVHSSNQPMTSFGVIQPSSSNTSDAPYYAFPSEGDANPSQLGPVDENAIDLDPNSPLVEVSCCDHKMQPETNLVYFAYQWQFLCLLVNFVATIVFSRSSEFDSGFSGLFKGWVFFQLLHAYLLTVSMFIDLKRFNASRSLSNCCMQTCDLKQNHANVCVYVSLVGLFPCGIPIFFGELWKRTFKSTLDRNVSLSAQPFVIALFASLPLTILSCVIFLQAFTGHVPALFFICIGCNSLITLIFLVMTCVVQFQQSGCTWSNVGEWCCIMFVAIICAPCNG